MLFVISERPTQGKEKLTVLLGCGKILKSYQRPHDQAFVLKNEAYNDLKSETVDQSIN